MQGPWSAPRPPAKEAPGAPGPPAPPRSEALLRVAVGVCVCVSFLHLKLY